MVTFTQAEKQQLFTSDRRFLYNEKQQLEGMRIEFDPEAVQRIASSVVNGDCNVFTKFAEGAFNKLYRLGFDNGRELIFRVPFPIAGPSHLVTASEVATMEFMRETLGAPVPRVLAWSSNIKANPVGSEFILMEKVPGESFALQWTTICREKADQFSINLMDRFCELQARCADLAFSQIGSLYFKEDVDEELQDRPLFADSVIMDGRLLKASHKYRIGPVASRLWWRGESARMKLDRGPWPDVSMYFRAAILSAIAFLKSPYSADVAFRRPPFHSVDEHLKLLEDCLQIVPYLIPPAEFCTPTIWHPDVTDQNIMTGPNFEFTGFIDWQHSIIAPYFQQHTSIPDAFIYTDGVLPIPTQGFPSLPSNFEEQDAKTQALYRYHMRRVTRHRAYELIMSINNPKRMQYSALHGIIRSWAPLPDVVLRTWSDGIATLRGLFAATSQYWPDISDEPFPVAFLSINEAQYMDEFRKSEAYLDNFGTLRRRIGCGGDGRVLSNSYEDVKRLSAEEEKSWMENEKGGPFPYRDGMWSYYLN
ncbi:kinase-like domain-containing protein [Abortiporus biennis]|nr:kinase-like domain-containing protein [Abortiporus biennis]